MKTEISVLVEEIEKATKKQCCGCEHYEANKCNAEFCEIIELLKKFKKDMDYIF